MRQTVVIAGATGAVGQALSEALGSEFNVVGLSRNARRAAQATRQETDMVWRSADLFSLLDAEQALAGADVAVYLMHAIIPSARLAQGSIRDFNLVLADNFARAAGKVGVKKIVYLSSIMPENMNPTPYHESRLEVERTLRAYGTPATFIRADLMIWEQGLVYQVVEKMIQRTPLIPIPRWMQTCRKPVALGDVVDELSSAVRETACLNVTNDIVGADSLSLEAMLKYAALAHGKTKCFVRVPFFASIPSSRCLRMLTGVSHASASQLVEKLKHSTCSSVASLTSDEHPGSSALEQMFRQTMPGSEETPAYLVKTKHRNPRTERASVVSSVQRLPLPENWTAADIADAYLRWLPMFLSPLLRIDVDSDENMHFYFRGLKLPLLELAHSTERSTPDRHLFYVVGGLLVDRSVTLRGRLEFRVIPSFECAMAAIHDFAPRLPWWIYKFTQAIAHLIVMRAFGAWLKRQDGRENLVQ